MDQQVCPDLLADTLGCLAAEDDACAALVRFDLGEDGLDLPALAVERGQLPGRIPSGIQQGGDQTVSANWAFAAPAGELIGQDPDHDRLIPVGPLLARICESHDPLRNCLITGRTRLAGTRHSRSAPVAVNACHNGTPEKLTIGQDELARADRPGQAGDQSYFPGAAAGEFRIQHRMAAHLHQRSHPHLRKRAPARPAATARTSEGHLVGFTVRDVPARSINRKQP
jgi:hypothetical protein